MVWYVSWKWRRFFPPKLQNCYLSSKHMLKVNSFKFRNNTAHWCSLGEGVKFDTTSIRLEIKQCIDKRGWKQIQHWQVQQKCLIYWSCIQYQIIQNECSCHSTFCHHTYNRLNTWWQILRHGTMCKFTMNQTHHARQWLEIGMLSGLWLREESFSQKNLHRWQRIKHIVLAF